MMETIKRWFLPLEDDKSRSENEIPVCRLCWLGLTENGSRLIDGGKALSFSIPPPSSEAAADQVSARGLRPVPYPQPFGPVLLPPYVNKNTNRSTILKKRGRVAARRLRGGFVSWDFHQDDIDGPQTMVQVETGSISLNVEDLLYCDFSAELRALIIDPITGKVQRMCDHATVCRATRNLGEWFIAEVKIGGQCVYECPDNVEEKKMRPATNQMNHRKVQLASTSFFQELAHTLFNSKQQDEIDGRWRTADGRLVTRVAARPALPQKQRNYSLESVFHNFAQSEPRVLAIKVRRPTIILLRQAYASLLRLLTIREARRRWADNLKDAMQRAVEDAKWSKPSIDRDNFNSYRKDDKSSTDLTGSELPIRLRHKVVGDDRRVSVSAENLYTSLLLSDGNADLDMLLGHIDFDDQTRAIIQASIAFLDTQIANNKISEPPSLVFDEYPFHFTLSPVDRWCPEDDYGCFLTITPTTSQGYSYSHPSNTRGQVIRASAIESPSSALVR